MNDDFDTHVFPVDDETARCRFNTCLRTLKNRIADGTVRVVRIGRRIGITGAEIKRVQRASQPLSFADLRKATYVRWRAAA